MMLRYFAHTGEAHATETEATLHAIPWPVQLIVLFAVMVLVYELVSMLTKKREVAALTTATLVLFMSFMLYQVAPVVSAVGISSGMVITLIVTLVGLGDTAQSKKSSPKNTKK